MSSGKEFNALSFNEKLDKVARRTIDLVGLMGETAAKNYCPVDKGLLRESIAANKIDDYTMIVGTNVEYAPYVEFGTGLFSVFGTGRQTSWCYQDSDGNWHTTIGQQPSLYMKKTGQYCKRKLKPVIAQVWKEYSEGSYTDEGGYDG